MMSLVKPRSRVTAIGLDIGAGGVRAAQLVRTGPNYSILRCARSEAVASPERDGDGVGTASARLVRRCLAAAPFRGRTVTTAVNAPDADFHALELPQPILAEETAEAELAVHWEVVRLMGVSADEVEVRHWAVPAAAGSTRGGPNALGIGVRRDRIDGLLETCKASGVACGGVDAAAAALSRFGGLLNRWPADAIWGILDLGHRKARLVVCADDVPVLVRVVGSGGAEWTSRIARTLQLSEKAAEVHKRQHGIAARSRSGVGPGLPGHEHDVRDELAALLLGALRGELTDIAAEIKRSYEYVLTCYPSRSACDLILVGGGAGMANLPQFWGEALGIRVRRASEYLDSGLGQRLACGTGLSASADCTLEAMALAVGLAVEQDA